MPTRLTLNILSASRAAGLTGPHIRHTRHGARLVGQLAGTRVSIRIPRDPKSRMTDHALCRTVVRAIAAADETSATLHYALRARDRLT